jgi:hypothetical protein
MMRLLLLLVASLGLLLATVLAGAARGDRQELGPVYVVRELQMSLQHAPGRWVGQTVRVRGVAWPCRGWASGPCLGRLPFLADVGTDAGLALARQPATPLAVAVRAAPLVGGLVPAGQTPQWGVLASYRVQIRAVPITACSYWPCYEVVLLDAAPAALLGE